MPTTYTLTINTFDLTGTPLKNQVIRIKPTFEKVAAPTPPDNSRRTVLSREVVVRTNERGIGSAKLYPSDDIGSTYTAVFEARGFEVVFAMPARATTMAEQVRLASAALRDGQYPVTGAAFAPDGTKLTLTKGDGATVEAAVPATVREDAGARAGIRFEQKERIDADVALGVRIDMEETARAGGDTALDARIDGEARTRQTTDTALGMRIENEATARAAADDALGKRIDGHGTGASLSNAAPKKPNDNAGAAGTASTASRADHRHPLPDHATESSGGLMSAEDKRNLDQVRADAHTLDLRTEDIEVETHDQWANATDATKAAFAAAPLSAASPRTFAVRYTPNVTTLNVRLRLPRGTKLNSVRLVQSGGVLTPRLWSQGASDASYDYYDALTFPAVVARRVITIQVTTRVSHSNVYTRDNLLFNSNEFEAAFDPVSGTTRASLKNEYALPDTRASGQVPVWNDKTKQWEGEAQGESGLLHTPRRVDILPDTLLPNELVTLTKNSTKAQSTHTFTFQNGLLEVDGTDGGATRNQAYTIFFSGAAVAGTATTRAFGTRLGRIFNANAVGAVFQTSRRSGTLPTRVQTQAWVARTVVFIATAAAPQSDRTSLQLYLGQVEGYPAVNYDLTFLGAQGTYSIFGTATTEDAEGHLEQFIANTLPIRFGIHHKTKGFLLASGSFDSSTTATPGLYLGDSSSGVPEPVSFDAPTPEPVAGTPPREITAVGNAYTLLPAENEVQVELTLTTAGTARTFALRLLRAELNGGVARRFVADSVNPASARNDNQFVGVIGSLSGDTLTLDAGPFAGAITSVYGLVSGAEGPKGAPGAGAQATYVDVFDAKSVGLGRTAAARQTGGRVYIGTPRAGPSQTLAYSDLPGAVLRWETSGPGNSALYLGELNLITDTADRAALNGTHWTIANTGTGAIDLVAIDNLDLADSEITQIPAGSSAILFLFASDTAFSRGKNFKLLAYAGHLQGSMTFWLTARPARDLGKNGDTAIVRRSATLIEIYRRNGSAPPGDPWVRFHSIDTAKPDVPTAPISRIYGTSQRLEDAIEYESRIKFRQTDRELTSTDLAQIGSGLQLQAIAVDHQSDSEDVFIFDLSSKNIAAFRDGTRTASLDINPVNSTIAGQNGAPDITSMSFGYGLSTFENTLFTVDTDIQEAIAYKRGTDGTWAYQAALTAGLRNAQLTALDSGFNPSAVGFLYYQGVAFIRIANANNRIVYQWRWNTGTSTWDRDAGDDIAASRFGSERPLAISYDGVFIATAASATASPQVRNQPATTSNILLPRPFLQRLSSGLQITDMDGSLTNRLYFLDGSANHVYAFWPSDLLEVDRNSLSGILTTPTKSSSPFNREPVTVFNGDVDTTATTRSVAVDAVWPENIPFVYIAVNDARTIDEHLTMIPNPRVRQKFLGPAVPTNADTIGENLSGGANSVSFKTTFNTHYLGRTSDNKILYQSTNTDIDPTPLQIGYWP